MAADTSSSVPVGDLEALRRPLTGYCYRMLGSAFDAEDAVQETLLRAWQRAAQLRDPRAEQAWVYRIATHVCLDMLRSAKRRALPFEVGAPVSHPDRAGRPRPESDWIWPIPDALVIESSDPAEVATQHESVRLAFIAALQLLPPRQRAVLILRDVLGWSAAEVADLLDMSAVAVNSALQRGRETLAASARTAAPNPPSENAALLDRYVDAFERFDLDMLTSLLHLDATLCMPPYSQWLRGRDEIKAWYAGPGSGCRGSRLCRLSANGSPALGQYRPGGKPWALHVLEVADGTVTAISSFLDTQRLFPLFGLPIEAGQGAQ